MGQAGGHKRGGTKPRNVKLRPAPAAAPPTAAAATTAGPSKKDKGKKAATKGSSSKHQDDDDADAAVDDSGYGDGQVKVPAEEEDEQDEDAFRDSLRRDRPPLEGCVVCLSGLQEPERTDQKRYAQALGARVDKALTVDTTHLICRKSEGAKYAAAIEHKKPVMSPQWLEELYSAFSDGSTVDVENAFRRHRLPALFGVHASLTGHASTPRQSLLSVLSDHGADHSATFSTSTTHLIVLSRLEAGFPPDDDILSDAKFLVAMERPNVQVVWSDWIEDSVAAGGLQPLGETDKVGYLVKAGRARPTRRFGPAPDSLAGVASKSDKGRSRAGGASEELLQASQKDRLESAVVKKKAALKKHGGSALEEDISFTNLERLTTKRPDRQVSAPAPGGDVDDDDELPDVPAMRDVVAAKGKRGAGEDAGPSRLAALMDKTSKKEASSVVKKLSTVRSDRFAAPSVPPAAGDSSMARGAPAFTAAGPSEPMQKIFAGLKFSVFGIADKKGQLAKAIPRVGGRFVQEHAEADYTILAHVNPVVPPVCNPVTVNWLERCCFSNQLLSPDEHFGDRPLEVVLPIPNTEHLVISYTGYGPGPALKALDRICKGFGLNFTEFPLKSSLTHCFEGPDKNSSRVRTVRKWIAEGAKIEIVDTDWLVRLAGCKAVTGGQENPANVEEGTMFDLPADVTGDVSTEAEGHEQSVRAEASPRSRRKSRKAKAAEQADLDEDTSADIRPEGPLSGCVLFLSKKIIGQARGASSDATRRLGGELATQITSAVTHFVHISDKAGDTAKELKQARAIKSFVVHPRWLDECRSTKSRVDECAFPPTYRPGTALSYSVIPDQAASQLRRTISNGSMKLGGGDAKSPRAGHAAALDDDLEMPPPMVFPKYDVFSPQKPSPIRRQAASLPSSPFSHHLNMDREEMDDSAAAAADVSMNVDISAAESSSPKKGLRLSSDPDLGHRPGPGAQTQMNVLLNVLRQGMTDAPAAEPKRAGKARPSRRVVGEGVAGISSTRSLSDLSAAPDLSRSLDRLAGSRIIAPLEGFGLDDGGFDHEPEESMRIGWKDPTAEEQKQRILRSLNGPGPGAPQSARKRHSEVDMLLAGSGGDVDMDGPPLKRSRPSKGAR